jgi:hypothetical protein
MEARSLDGIISYLTRKHGGNVHDKGIVTITSIDRSAVSRLGQQDYKNTSEEKLSTMAISQNFTSNPMCCACLLNETKFFRTVSIPNCEESRQFVAIKVDLTKKIE